MHALRELDRTVERWWPAFMGVPASPLRNLYFAITLLAVGVVASILEWPYALAPISASLGIFIGTALQLRCQSAALACAGCASSTTSARASAG